MVGDRRSQQFSQRLRGIVTGRLLRQVIGPRGPLRGAARDRARNRWDREVDGITVEQRAGTAPVSGREAIYVTPKPFGVQEIWGEEAAGSERGL